MPPTSVVALQDITEAEFSTLRDGLKVSDSVLSKHVAARAALAPVGYVQGRNGLHAGLRTTWIVLTSRSRTGLVPTCGAAGS
jgi:Winged helix DNA-binding domain